MLQALILSEANILFDTYLHTMQQQDPDHQQNPMLLKAKEYTVRFANMSNTTTIRKMRE